METSKLNFGSYRKKLLFIRIGNKLHVVSIWFLKKTSVKTCESTRQFLQSTSDDVSDSIDWKDKDYIPSEDSILIDNNVKSTSDS